MKLTVRIILIVLMPKMENFKGLDFLVSKWASLGRRVGRTRGEQPA
jgi:hypothetical protein